MGEPDAIAFENLCESLHVTACICETMTAEAVAAEHFSLIVCSVTHSFVQSTAARSVHVGLQLCLGIFDHSTIYELNAVANL
jgi:hypothetical protein